MTIDLMNSEHAAGLLTPTIGRVRARISRPLHVEPGLRGRFGRAWLCDLDAARRTLGPGAPGDAMLAHWIVEAPWSHQVVHSYSMLLMHLRFMIGKQAVTRRNPGATHEFHMYAIRPDVDREPMLREPMHPDNWLRPIVFAAQLAETSDLSALCRVRRSVELVCEGRISPHPSHVREWGELMGDNMLSGG